MWKMDPHQARMVFAQAVDNSLIPGKLLINVQHLLYERFISIKLSMLLRINGVCFLNIVLSLTKGEKEPYWNTILNLDYLCVKYYD